MRWRARRTAGSRRRARSSPAVPLSAARCCAPAQRRERGRRPFRRGDFLPPAPPRGRDLPLADRWFAAWNPGRPAEGSDRSACRDVRAAFLLRAKLTARRSCGLFRKSGREELRTNIETVKPGVEPEPLEVDGVLADETVGRPECDRRERVRPVSAAGGDLADQLVRRGAAELDVEAGDVVLAVAAVVGVAPDLDLPIEAVLLDVVRPGARERSHALAARLQRGRDGAEERHRRPGVELGHRTSEADDERVPAASSPPRLASPSRRGRPRRRRSRACRHSRASRHPVPSSGRSPARTRPARTGLPLLKRKPLRSRNVQVLPSARDGRRGRRDVRHELVAPRRGRVAIAHQPCADRVQERPALARVRQSRVDVVERPRARQEGDLEDPARPRIRRPLRAGLDRDCNEARDCQAEQQE